MIVIIFNLLVIIVAIFALIYENNVNNVLLKKIQFYKAVYTFNTLILVQYLVIFLYYVMLKKMEYMFKWNERLFKWYYFSWYLHIY